MAADCGQTAGDGLHRNEDKPIPRNHKKGKRVEEREKIK